MNLDTPLLALIVFLVVGTIAFLVGWNAAVGKHIEGRRRLERRADLTNQRIDKLNERLDHDSTRAGIQIGKDYVMSRLAKLMDELRREDPT